MGLYAIERVKRKKELLSSSCSCPCVQALYVMFVRGVYDVCLFVYMYVCGCS